MPNIIYLKDNKPLFNNVLNCNTFIKKFMGLMFKKSWPYNCDALLFSGCNMIHSFFVRYSFDAVFLNKEKIIIYQKTFKPWEIGPYIKNGFYVLETPSNIIDKFNLKINDKLIFDF